MKFSKIKILICLFLITYAFVSCSDSVDPNYDSDYEALKKLDTKDAISLGNEWHYNAPEIVIYATTQEAVFEFPDGRSIKKAMPEDSMYIAIAPYINGTHTCATHYLSSCDGEMKNEFLNLEITDENNKIIFKDKVKTMKNGFFELWLPRNHNYLMRLNYNSLSGEETFSTNVDSKTCITTVQLK